MGVKNISKILKNYSKPIDLKDISDKRIAIDTSIYLYKFKYNTKNNDFIKKFIYQLYSFKKYNITPIYVFDTVPEEHKKPTLEKRKQIKNDCKLKIENETDIEQKEKLEKKFIQITKQDIIHLKTLFKLCNIEYLNSLTEAEKQCACLNKNGKVDYVLSNDYDCLSFGCKKLITLDSSKGYFEYDLEEILNDKNISLQDYIELCIACGTDYFPKGISNIGPVKALNNVKKYGAIEKWKNISIDSDMDLDSIRNIFTSEAPDAVECSQDTQAIETMENLNDFVSQIDVVINPRIIEQIFFT